MVGNASTGREVSRLISYTSVCLIFTPVGYNLKQWPGFYKNIIFTRQMCFGAAPSILFRPFHDSGLHRVQFYISRCTSDIVRPLERKRIFPARDAPSSLSGNFMAGYYHAVCDMMRYVRYNAPCYPYHGWYSYLTITVPSTVKYSVPGILGDLVDPIEQNRRTSGANLRICNRSPGVRTYGTPRCVSVYQCLSCA